MKEDIKNIIDLDQITQIRRSVNVAALNNIRENSIVKLIPLEYLEHGVKVLIDGKLFIAFIEGEIPLKEEIIAVVKSSKPFSLSLNVVEYSDKNHDELINNILNKFEIANTDSMKQAVKKVLAEGKVLIKNKLLTLDELGEYLKVDGIEYSLLVNLVWSYKERSKYLIKELYNDLFTESFEQICQNLFDSIEQLIFSDIPFNTLNYIKTNFIYNPSDIVPSTLLNKVDAVYNVIKMINQESQLGYQSNEAVEKFIINGSKYIFQKSLFKDYDYYPDFVIIERNLELDIINYKVKKLFHKDGHVSYKIDFQNKNLPFELKGLLRNNLFIGNIEADQVILESEEIDEFKNKLKTNWNITTELNSAKESVKSISRKLDVNKLVS